jgi:hypothetical protein
MELVSLTEHHAVQTYGRAEVQLYALTSAVDGVEWPTSYSGRFIPEERTPVHIGEEAGWIPEAVCMLWRREKCSPAEN